MLAAEAQAYALVRLLLQRQLSERSHETEEGAPAQHGPPHALQLILPLHLHNGMHHNGISY